MAWNPWRALRNRDHIHLHRHPSAHLAGGAYHATNGPNTIIVLSPDLDRRHRNAALAHELIHDERGVHDPADAPPAWSAVVAREERHVDREVARRLVPPSELQAAVARWTSMGEAVTAQLVADEFDVPEAVASVALAELRRVA
ncbi:MAG: hypothetical protein JJU45_15240 [Acidimicrobiia bacterium]|nr:hypothetical protein [Acidimicrobiia bacterium]